MYSFEHISRELTVQKKYQRLILKYRRKWKYLFFSCENMARTRNASRSVIHRVRTQQTMRKIKQHARPLHVRPRSLAYYLMMIK